MKKLFSSLSKFSLALCLTLHTAHGMDSHDQVYERPSLTVRYSYAMGRGEKVSEEVSLIFVMECRILSALSYESGEKAQNLWEKRNSYVRALKFLDVIDHKSPAQWNQQGTENYNKIIAKMQLWRYAIWNQGMSLICEPHEKTPYL